MSVASAAEPIPAYYPPAAQPIYAGQPQSYQPPQMSDFGYSGLDQADNPLPGAEIMTSGPVHEAFAEPITFNPTPGVAVNAEPPAPIQEALPDTKPIGENVVWIPGYWSWDDDRQGFVWVSGIWRNIPPGLQWAPGYWAQVEGGFQWVSGYWAPIAAAEQPQYLPTPPDTLDQGPIGVPMSVDDVWSPGYWAYANTGYGWRAGGWMRPMPGRVWIPAHYIWTPRGCIFVPGYWDYAIDQRGLLFAPVAFDAGFYSQPGFCYTPAVVVNVTFITVNLFIGPGRHHYFFGDYYDDRCHRRGFVPSYEFHRNHGGYDPIFASQQWDHRRDTNNWQDSQRRRFEQLRDNRNDRPARTFRAELANRAAGRNTANNLPAVRTLRDLSVANNAPVRVEKLNTTTRERLTRETTVLTRSQETRVTKETKAGKTARFNAPVATLTTPKINANAPVTSRINRTTPAAATPGFTPPVTRTTPAPNTTPRTFVPRNPVTPNPTNTVTPNTTPRTFVPRNPVTPNPTNTVTPNTTPRTFVPRNPVNPNPTNTVTPNTTPRTFVPRDTTSTVTPNTTPRTFVPRNPVTPNPTNTVTPNTTPRTFVPRDTTSTVTPDTTPRTFVPRNSTNTVTPNRMPVSPVIPNRTAPATITPPVAPPVRSLPVVPNATRVTPTVRPAVPSTPAVRSPVAPTPQPRPVPVAPRTVTPPPAPVSPTPSNPVTPGNPRDRSDDKNRDRDRASDSNDNPGNSGSPAGSSRGRR